MLSTSFRFRKDISAKRVKRWAFSIHELLKDPAGKEHFIKFLGKEFSDENLRYVRELRLERSLFVTHVHT